MVADVVCEFGELVEDEVGRVPFQVPAGVIDFLDVGLRAGGADHVIGMGDPAVQPFEALAAHVFGEHSDAPAPHEPGDGHPAPGVVPGRRPDGPMLSRVELAGDYPGH